MALAGTSRQCRGRPRHPAFDAGGITLKAAVIDRQVILAKAGSMVPSMRDLYVVLVVVAMAACSPARRPDGSGGVDASGQSDAPESTGDGSVSGEMSYVYAHSSSTLYKIDPDTLAVTRIADFGWPAPVGSDQMTDLAIDKTGRMIGVSFGSVYTVDPMTAQCTLLSSSLGGSFNGVSFVPAAMVGATGDDVLVGTRNSDGLVFRIDPMTGAATQVGDMGAQFQSSGDLVAVAGFGTVQTTLGAASDVLVKLDPITFTAHQVGTTSTGFNQIWGVAFWKGKIFGFSQTGQFVVIDATTGVGTLVQSNGPAWWGAAVTTLAPVIQ
jgi:hypothetical protein